MKSAPLQPATVLVAEDDDEMRLLLTVYLEMEGYRVRAVGDGRAVLRALDDEGLQPDVLVTDVHMPNLNGLELLRRLQERAASPPTIVITSFGDRDIHAQARALGAAGVFDKPFDSRRLVEAINALLQAG